jgi:hypothetical protein
MPRPKKTNLRAGGRAARLAEIGALEDVQKIAERLARYLHGQRQDICNQAMKVAAAAPRSSSDEPAAASSSAPAPADRSSGEDAAAARPKAKRPKLDHQPSDGVAAAASASEEEQSSQEEQSENEMDPSPCDQLTSLLDRAFHVPAARGICSLLTTVEYSMRAVELELAQMKAEVVKEEDAEDRSVKVQEHEQQLEHLGEEREKIIEDLEVAVERHEAKVLAEQLRNRDQGSSAAAPAASSSASAAAAAASSSSSSSPQIDSAVRALLARCNVNPLISKAQRRSLKKVCVQLMQHQREADAIKQEQTTGMEAGPRAKASQAKKQGSHKTVDELTLERDRIMRQMEQAIVEHAEMMRQAAEERAKDAAEIDAYEAEMKQLADNRHAAAESEAAAMEVSDTGEDEEKESIHRSAHSKRKRKRANRIEEDSDDSEVELLDPPSEPAASCSSAHVKYEPGEYPSAPQ